MFDRIARRYQLGNFVLSMGQDARWRKKAIRSLQLGPHDRLLDLATGNGQMLRTAQHLAPHALSVGLDPSIQMLSVDHPTWKNTVFHRVQGRAEHLPFADNSFDAVCMAFGIRNVPDRHKGLAEMYRVLKPGGRIAILELSMPPRRGLLGRLAHAYVEYCVPIIGGVLSNATDYKYLRESIAQFPPPNAFLEMMKAAGFQHASATAMTFGSCQLYVAEKKI